MYTVNSTTSIIIAATGLLLLVLAAAVITGILCTAVAMRQKQHTTGNIDYYIGYNLVSISSSSGVIDHVPVDDNPAYITMKRITLNNNTAYETVNINETINTSAVYETVS